MQTKQTDLARLLMGTKVFVVPQFQRHYKWKVAQWQELWDDIIDQYDSEDVQSGNLTKDEGHFLGSVVLHPAPGPASTVSRYWVIDGQQRLTTLLVLIAALRDLRAEMDPLWDPNAYTNLYLANQYNPDAPHRLVLGANDRADFVETVYHQTPSGQVGQAYRWFSMALRKRAALISLDFEQFQNAVLLRLLLVEINTSDDDNINQIFNTINHSGMRLSAIDLIRNHSFMQFDADSAEAVYESTWKPLEDSLGESLLSQYLWAQLVRRNPKATQRDLYGPFQSHLLATAQRMGLSVPETTRLELTRLRDEVETFLVVTDSARTLRADLPYALQDVLLDLQEWGSQTYIPIALEVLGRSASGQVTTEAATRALKLVLSYLVRRGLAGIPSNNLNRILSSIPNAVTDAADVATAVSRELMSSGKYWPRDREVAERAISTPIYLTLQPRQVKFVLAELNDAELSTEPVRREELTVEHIMPRELTDNWLEMLEINSVSPEIAESRLHVLGNLTLTGINSDLARRPPEAKVELLAQSNLPLNREFPPSPIWTPSEIDRRSADLVRRALAIWTRPTDETLPHSGPQLAMEGPEKFDVALLLDALPADSHLHLVDLAELIAESEFVAAELVKRSGYPLLRDESNDLLVGGMREMTASELAGTRRASISEVVRLAQALGSQQASDVP